MLIFPVSASARPELGLGLGYVQDCPLAAESTTKNTLDEGTETTSGSADATSEVCYHGGRFGLDLNFLHRAPSSGPDFSFGSMFPMFNGFGLAAIMFVAALVIFGAIYAVLILFISELKAGVFYAYDHQGSIAGQSQEHKVTQYRAHRVGIKLNMYPFSFIDLNILLAAGYAHATYEQSAIFETEPQTREGYSLRFGFGYEPTAKESGIFARFEYERLYFEPTNLQKYVSDQNRLALPDGRENGALLLGYKWGTGK